MPRPPRSLSVLLLVLAGCAAEPPPVPEPGTIEARLRRGLVSVSADESPGYALDWQPPAVAIPEGGREAALAVAGRALHEGRLYEDAEAAIPIHLALLRRDPGDVQARAGLAHAIEALWTEGERRLAAVEHEDAALGPLREIAAVARYIAPEAPQTLDLLVRLDAADRLLALTEHGENELAAGRLGEDGLGALTAFREVLRNRPGDARALDARAERRDAAHQHEEEVASRARSRKKPLEKWKAPNGSPSASDGPRRGSGPSSASTSRITFVPLICARRTTSPTTNSTGLASPAADVSAAI